MESEPLIEPPKASSVHKLSQKPPQSEEECRRSPNGQYLLVSIVADVKCVAVFVHLLRPASRWGAVLTVRLARVGAEAGVLR